MARKTQKQLETLARNVAHRGEVLNDFERLLFWTRLLWHPEPARALTLMREASHAADRARWQQAADLGLAQARLLVTLELAIWSHTQPNSAPGKSALTPLIFTWHDWPSYEMELRDWLRALPQKELSAALAQQVREGLSASIAAMIESADSGTA